MWAFHFVPRVADMVGTYCVVVMFTFIMKNLPTLELKEICMTKAVNTKSLIFLLPLAQENHHLKSNSYFETKYSNH